MAVQQRPSAAPPRSALASPAALRPADLVALQRSIGNRATARLLAPLEMNQARHPSII